MKILVMGGTRFIGKSLVKKLRADGHELILFTRGKLPVPKSVKHIRGDRKNYNDLKLLSGNNFDVIIDTSGRSLEDTKLLIESAKVPTNRLIYVSSAGVYKKSSEIPLEEDSEIDPESRHIGKSETENWLYKNDIPFTSFRPTYIYGPGNYNPIERWFFDRIINNRPIPIPGNGETITQLGHVNDLASAMALSLRQENTKNKIYNCSGKKGITFNGIVEIACKVCNKNIDNMKFIYFDPSKLNSKERKVFPLRIENFYTSIASLEKDLGWQPEFNLLDGFKDSYLNDYKKNPTVDPDFSRDEEIFSNLGI